MATKADSDFEAIRAEFGLLRAQMETLMRERDELRAEVGQLRSAVRTSTGREAAPVIHRSTTTALADGYERDPAHDPDYVQAVMRGDADGMRVAMTAAMQRLAADRYSGPGRPADFDVLDAPFDPEADGRQRAEASRRATVHRQRRDLAEAQKNLDLTGLPVEPGGVFTKDRSGQVHISYPRQVTCSSGHPAGPADRYCSTCGGTIAAPAVGQSWPGNDPDELRDQVLDGMRTERIAEEG